MVVYPCGKALELPSMHTCPLMSLVTSYMSLILIRRYSKPFLVPLREAELYPLGAYLNTLLGPT
jgi:hypothetical protein